MSFLAGSKSTPSHSQSGRQQRCVAHLWVRSWSNRGQKIQHRKHSTRVNNNRVRALHGCRSRLQFHIRYVFLRANRRCWNRMICMPAGKKNNTPLQPPAVTILVEFWRVFFACLGFLFCCFFNSCCKVQLYMDVTSTPFPSSGQNTKHFSQANRCIFPTDNPEGSKFLEGTLTLGNLFPRWCTT